MARKESPDLILLDLGLPAGASFFLKPFDAAELLSGIRQALGA